MATDEDKARLRAAATVMLVRDSAAMLRCLGIDLDEAATKAAAGHAGRGMTAPVLGTYCRKLKPLPLYGSPA